MNSTPRRAEVPAAQEQRDRVAPDDAAVCNPALTRALVEQALKVRHEDLPADVRRIARDCLADWLGCTLAGLDEPASRYVAELAFDEGGNAQATLIGLGAKTSLLHAALVNGTASHALDYDDVNLALPGHLSVAIVPALLALAEHRNARSGDFIAAFVAGYEFGCRVGVLVEPAHYANGFHATATIGALAAAVACAHLLRLPTAPTAHAVGTAATQAAGLKAMFGSMAKPLHAGLAAQAGLRSALLAAKGFTSRTDALECAQGFAAVHGADFHAHDALKAPPGGFHLLDNLFKFHAACFSTHSTIEAVSALRRANELRDAQVARIRVLAGEPCSICNIQWPATALEAKFSLRAAAAFALLDIDTGRLDTWQRVTDEDVRAVIERVQVDLVPGMGLSESIVAVETTDGRSFRREVDCGTPLTDKAEQSRRVAAKFRAVAAPVIGDERCRRVLDRLDGFERATNVTELVGECRRESHRRADEGR